MNADTHDSNLLSIMSGMIEAKESETGSSDKGVKWTRGSRTQTAVNVLTQVGSE